MYITDVKKEFYEYLIGKNIVLIVHHDVDAICSCRILQTLVKYNSIQYTLIPVKGIKDLKNAYKENCEQVKCFVLINCGGTIDLVEELDPTDDTIFFVLDSHRPTDVCNIYSNDQIRLLWAEEDDQNVPEFDDIFRDDDTEDVDEEGSSQGVEHTSDDEDSENESRAAKRRRLGEQDILKRRERRLWEDKRDKLMFEYSQYSYYAKASALTLFDLAHTLARDTKELLWLTILSLSEQHLLGKIESSQYTMLIGSLQMHMDRLNHRRAKERDSKKEQAPNSLQITSEKELKVSLYRHWSVERSLICSLYPSCRMKLWTRRGERRLQELLAEIGLPLAQSKQRYAAMELTYRQEFPKQLERVGAKFGLDDIVYASFVIKYGYKGRFAAADMVYAVLALMEQTSRSAKEDANFSDALDFLAKPVPQQLLEAGLERAKLTLESCHCILKAALDQRKIYSAGPFLYFILHEATSDSTIFSRPHALQLLGRYLQSGYCERQGARASSAAMPLLVSAPRPAALYSASTSSSQPNADDTQPLDETCLLVGLPPLCENSPKNFFGKAFEQAAERSNASASLDYFDSSYIVLRTADRTRFLDSLTALLS